MTKEKYLEMCDMLGTTPIDTEIPTEYEDLYLEVQIAIDIYTNLPDIYDSMSGQFRGKDYSSLLTVLTLFEIEEEERLTYFKILRILDGERKKLDK